MSYPVVLDVWEGQLDVNEGELKNGGVVGLLIRLNNTVGGHHLDANFFSQWAQAGASGLYRAPYFVYNPWVTGPANFDWLKANCPETYTVCIDIEVRRAGYTPQQYAADVAAFMSRAEGYWKHVVIYSGGGYMDMLSYWPVCEYWWARYPYSMYPPTREVWTWDHLHSTLNVMAWAPGTTKKVQLWQCSGDRIILPGCVRAVDISIFNGSVSELQQWFGQVSPNPIPSLESQVADHEVRIEKLEARVFPPASG